MTEGAIVALAVLVWLQIKHLLCDFYFQTPRQIEMKGVYGHPAGISHAAQHAVASIPVFVIMPVSALVAVAIVIGEFVAHYHVDWVKAVIGDRKGWTVRDKEYWRGLGSDQFLHQITYLGICGLLIWVRG